MWDTIDKLRLSSIGLIQHWLVNGKTWRCYPSLVNYTTRSTGKKSKPAFWPLPLTSSWLINGDLVLCQVDFLYLHSTWPNVCLIFHLCAPLIAGSTSRLYSLGLFRFFAISLFSLKIIENTHSKNQRPIMDINPSNQCLGINFLVNWDYCQCIP